MATTRWEDGQFNSEMNIRDRIAPMRRHANLAYDEFGVVAAAAAAMVMLKANSPQDIAD